MGKRGNPATFIARKWKAIKAAGNNKAIRAVYRVDVVPSRIFFKCGPVGLDKLIRNSVFRYFFLKGLAFFFCMGQFFFSLFVGGSQYFKLLGKQSNAFTQDVSGHASCDGGNTFLGKSVDDFEAHDDFNPHKR